MLLEYEYFANPPSHKEILAHFRTFAQARGWTIDDYRTNAGWGWTGSQYDWVAGNDDFLQISSAGFGSQNLVYRFRFEGGGSDPQAEKVTICGIDPGQAAIDNSSGTHPVLQNAYTHSYFREMTMSPGQSPGTWFFGNHKYLIAICRHTTELWVGWYTGTIELFDAAETDACWAVTSSYQGGSYKWYQAFDYQYNFIAPWNNMNGYYATWWWRGAGRCQESNTPDNLTSGNRYIASNLSADTNDGLRGIFDRQGALLLPNQYSGKRMLIKPVFYAARADDRTVFPLGELPFYYLDYTGYRMGDVLTYGDEQYLVFPNVFQHRRYGNAFRIA